MQAFFQQDQRNQSYVRPSEKQTFLELTDSRTGIIALLKREKGSNASSRIGLHCTPVWYSSSHSVV